MSACFHRSVPDQAYSSVYGTVSVRILNCTRGPSIATPAAVIRVPDQFQSLPADREQSFRVRTNRYVRIPFWWGVVSATACPKRLALTDQANALSVVV